MDPYATINKNMIVPTNYTVSTDLLDRVMQDPIYNSFDINVPTGRFFYDPWQIKPEFKNTAWEEVLNTLPEKGIGEAKVRKLDIKTCYTRHADIDDRWHLSFETKNSFLVDLEKDVMHNTTPGVWYSMNAGIMHSAVNFGDSDRYQLVVRKLLPNNQLTSPIKIKMTAKNPPRNYRYIFDQHISPKLNKWCKEGVLTNFAPNSNYIEFELEKTYINELQSSCKDTKIEIELIYDAI